MINIFKSKKSDTIAALEDEIYNLKAKILDQEKIIQHATNSNRGRLALEQIKKIESLEAEVKRQQKRVKDAKAVAQEAHRVKSEFLSNIRHEIRTPMNSIIVFAELLVQETQTPKLQNYAKNIYTSGKKLLEMIDDIINLSKVERGTFTLDEKPVEIKTLIGNIVKFQRDEAARKGLEFTLDIDADLPDSLMLDESKIEDIFTNLIENAIKFTKRGFVHVKLLKNGEDIVKNAVNMTLIVEDSGVGINEDDREKIFEIFEKSTVKDKTAGMGLGLSINKRMAREMNGDIYLEPKAGEGSKFVFTIKDVEVVLPSTESQDFNADMIDFSLIRPEGGTIMVVDENAEVRNLIRDVFFESALKVLSFDNPRDAIDTLKKSDVDMIYIDIDMLTSDDNAVSKILRGISQAPVVTLTDKRIKDIDLRSSAAKIAGHLKKPLLKSELFKVSLHALNNTKQRQHALVLEDESIFDHLERSQVEGFLSLASKQLNRLYANASSTNDLEAIRAFAKELLNVSQECDIKELVQFAEKLLVKIDLFEIEAINTMLQEYKRKISLLKKSIV
ncbi:ATP-binding response regulator [Sulfurimonas paralvinellae]|uniref:histidine kinase n=1 Tax=Sulfurimonas paralvinellae TaxID=317658 RepID=A0A7M1B7S8_9BACT|nr:ATP-binding protein [Sulfurimonas paralvinellae]QOP45754.1 response regulator [Sulfurimonas paralvinellae]